MEQKSANDPRSEAARDRDRLIHSSSFRRLQGKSQIVGVDLADYFRTRLTHSLECAQIGKAIATQVHADSRIAAAADHADDFPDIVEAACLAHDLGHPPFGHNGEKALQSRMKERNGSLFEGNAQSFRVVTYLEPKRYQVGTDRSVGLNLTRASLRALLKYPYVENRHMLTESGPKFGVYDDSFDLEYFEWVWNGDEPKRNLATEIMDVADEVAYGVHDFEDGVWSRMIPLYDLLHGRGGTRERLLDEVERQDGERERKGDVRLFHGNEFDQSLADFQKSKALTYLRDVPFDGSRQARAELKNFTAELIGHFVIATTTGGAFTPLAGADARKLALLKAMAWAWMILRTDLRTHQYGQRRLVAELFEGYWAEPDMLPRREEWDEVREISRRRRIPSMTTSGWRRTWPEKARLICDHIAGMTDAYALRVHAQMHRGQQERDVRLAY